MNQPQRTVLLSWVGLGLALLALASGVTTSARAVDSGLAAEPLQASCGDGRCSPPEDCQTCEADCGDCCGDHRCAPPEDRDSCPRDCD